MLTALIFDLWWLGVICIGFVGLALVAFLVSRRRQSDVIDRLARALKGRRAGKMMTAIEWGRPIRGRARHVVRGTRVSRFGSPARRPGSFEIVRESTGDRLFNRLGIAAELRRPVGSTSNGSRPIADLPSRPCFHAAFGDPAGKGLYRPGLSGAQPSQRRSTSRAHHGDVAMAGGAIRTLMLRSGVAFFATAPGDVSSPPPRRRSRRLTRRRSRSVRRGARRARADRHR